MKAFINKNNNITALQTEAGNVVSWLDTASHILNPDRIPNFQISIMALEHFINTSPPPPHYLAELWAKLLWPILPGEPFLIFLTRALASHFAVTCLSPRLRVVERFQSYPLRHSLTGSTFGEHYQRMLPQEQWSCSRLSTEICCIVGLRLYPYYTTLVQSGWALQSCPACATQQAYTTQRNKELIFTDTCALLQSYGGNTCSHCGQELSLYPVWSRHFFLVLQRQDGTRCAAVTYGDDLYPILQPGHVLRALLYVGTTEKGESLVVVHNATVFLSTAEWITSSVSMGVVRAGMVPLSCALSSQTRQHRAIRGCGSRPKMSLAEWCRLLAPEIVGQDSCKSLLILSVIHTLYRAVRRGTGSSERLRPLHVLLVGPTKCGKSALLRDLARLYGSAYATVIRPWHGSVGGMTSTADYGLGASLPSIRGNVLLCGAALENIALMLDEAVLGASCMTIVEQLLEDGSCVSTVMGTGTAPMTSTLESLGQSTFLSDVQLIASIQEESRFTLPLARFFPLVAYVSPQMSLAYSVSIGQNVVAASTARTLPSRCTNSLTSSSQRSFDGSQNGGSSAGLGGTTLGVEAFLDVDTLVEIVRCAPDEETLYPMLDWPSLTASYLQLLQAHRHLLVAPISTFGSLTLPMPASCRGQNQGLEGDAAMQSKQCSLDDSLQEHLRVLSALSLARLVLEGSGNIGWSVDLLWEVWNAYAYHLYSFTHLLDSVARKPGPPPQVVMNSLPPSSGFDEFDRACRDSFQDGCVVGKRRRTSRKSCKLHLVELLRRESTVTSSGEVYDKVLTTSQIEALYLRLGGMTTMGDSFDVVLNQLQQEGLLIQRLGGWKLTKV